MDHNILLVFGIFSLVVIIIAIFFFGVPSVKKIGFINPDWFIWVDVANNPLKQTAGLMFRSNLPPNTGMLFEFPDEKPRSFWMLFTLIPLEAIHVNSQGKIVNIIPMNPCTSLACPTYSSSTPAKYVIEVPQGFSEINGVYIGQKITGL